MDLFKKNSELKILLLKYLNHEIELNELQEFAWSIINYFNATSKSSLPPFENFERAFWYTIWQIQHLSDEEHEQEGVTQRVFAEALDFLEKRKQIPKNYSGMRP